MSDRKTKKARSWYFISTKYSCDALKTNRILYRGEYSFSSETEIRTVTRNLSAYSYAVFSEVLQKNGQRR